MNPDGHNGAGEEQRHGDGQQGDGVKWLAALGGLLLVVAPLLSGFRRLVRPHETLTDSGWVKAIRDHERRDANAKWIFGIVAFLLVSGLAIHFILAGMLKSLNGTAPPTDLWRPSQPPAKEALKAAPFPVLQVSAPADLKSFRAREEETLQNYGWVDRRAGVVRVPIERAMELVLQEGLPVRTSTNANRAGPSAYQLIRQRLEHRQPEIQGEK